MGNPPKRARRNAVMEHQVIGKFREPFPDKPYRLPGDDFECEGETLAKQSEADACDINLIMARYVKTGVIEHVRENAGQYLHLPRQFEYQDAVNVVLNSESAFAAMPAEIRARFGNSPAAFLQFADQNADYLEKLGIVSPDAPLVAPGVPAAPAGGAAPVAPAAPAAPVVAAGAGK